MVTGQGKTYFGLLLLAPCLAALLWGCKSKPQLKPLSSVMLSAVTEPAVFKVVSLAEYQLRDVRFSLNGATLAPISSRPDCWASIAEAPDQYIKTSLKSDRILSVRKTFASGSSFAVAPNGVFLTNTHVIAPPDTTKLDEVFPAISESILALISGLRAPNTPFATWRRHFTTQVLHNLRAPAGCLDDLPDDNNFRDAFVSHIAVWMLRQTLTKARIAAVYVVTSPREFFRYTPPQLGKLKPGYAIGNWNLQFGHRGPLFSKPESLKPDPDEINVNLEVAGDNPQTYATETEVVASGQIFPGEDVAVLRSKKRLELIALPLGDSSPAELPDGSVVVAFGFPGAAEMKGLKQDRAHPKVIAHDGKMVQRVQTEKEWEALYITAAVSEGDSGGPIVDRYGRVVALTVYGNQNRAGNNVAVPINIAKNYLERAKVHADAGPLTSHWLAGQDYYSRGEYSRALEEFEIVNGTRVAPDINPLLPTWRNDYVLQAIANCKLKQHTQ